MNPFAFTDSEIAAITDGLITVLSSGRLTQGAAVEAFETSFAESLRLPRCTAVNSGTAALQAIFEALEVRDRTVLIPTNTFIATPVAAIRAGARVRFVDCDDRYQPDVDHLARSIAEDDVYVAVMVHIGGFISERISEVVDLCDANDVVLVEDAAHAHGVSRDGVAAGAFGRAAAFSLYPTKVATSGEGGMVASADAELHNRIRVLRDQGKPSFESGEQVAIGSNWRMSEIHAVVGSVSLAGLEERIRGRSEVAAMFDEALEEVDGVTPVRTVGSEVPNRYKYVVTLDPDFDAAAVREAARAEGLQLTGEVYATPCHKQPALEAAWENISLPRAEELCRRQLCLAAYQGMDASDVAANVKALEACVAQARSA